MASSGAVQAFTQPSDTELPLPPLLLPPRQLKKIQVSCKRSLIRFLLTLSTTPTAAATQRLTSDGGSGAEDGVDVVDLAAHVCPAWRDATGFVALNGGILAGCTPHDLRTTLLELDVVESPPSPLSLTSILEYSSTLPFVLCSRRLAVTDGMDAHAALNKRERSQTHPNLSKVNVSAAELRHFAASTRASSGVGVLANSFSQRDSVEDETLARAATARGTEGRSTAFVSVGVLQLPSSVSLWKSGSSSASSSSSSSSSANRGCGFLFVLPCNVEAVRQMLRHVFQKPVVNIDALLFEQHQQQQHEEEEKGGMASIMTEETPRKRRQLPNLTAVESGQGVDKGVETPPPPRWCVSAAVPGVPGLYLIHDFVSAAEEAAIWQELHDNRQRLQLEHLSRRRVAHFNRRFIYGANQLTDEGEGVNARPSFYDWMRGRLQNADPDGAVRICGDFPLQPGTHECDQLTVNYYDYSEMGVCGIATHVDAHSAFDEAVLVVSLGSYTVMDFARWDAPAAAAVPTGVYLPPRSLAIMSGESRYGWTHCIAERRTDTVSELVPTCTRGDRLSLTWRRGRTQRHRKADCPFPDLCDGD